MTNSGAEKAPSSTAKATAKATAANNAQVAGEIGLLLGGLLLSQGDQVQAIEDRHFSIPIMRWMYGGTSA